MVQLLASSAPLSTKRARAEGIDGPRNGNQRPVLGITSPNASPHRIEFVGGIASRTRIASRGQPQCTLRSCSSRWAQALQRGQAQGRLHHRSARSDQRWRILGGSCRVHRTAGNEIPGPRVSAPGPDDSTPVPEAGAFSGRFVGPARAFPERGNGRVNGAATHMPVWRWPGRPAVATNRMAAPSRKRSFNSPHLSSSCVPALAASARQLGTVCSKITE